MFGFPSFHRRGLLLYISALISNAVVRCGLFLTVCLGGMLCVSPVRADTSADSVAALRALIRAGEFADAQTEAARLLAGFHPANRADSLIVLDATDVLVEALVRLNEYDDPALPRNLDSLFSLSRSLLDPNSPTILRAHRFAGYLARAHNDRDAELEHFSAALDLVDRSRYATATDRALALGHLADSYYRWRDYATAVELLERARATLEADLPPDDPRLGPTLINLNLARIAVGDTAGVAGTFSRVRRIYEGSSEYDVQLADAFLREGTWRLSIGDPSGAAPVLERALRLLEGRRGAGTRLADGLLARAQAHLAAGETDSAFARASRARGLYAERQAASPEVASCLVTMGDANRRAWRHREASGDYRSALDILESEGGRDPARLADCLQALASHSMELAHYTEALDYARRAYDVNLHLWGPGDRRTLRAELAYGAASRSAGQPDSAEAFCRRALAGLEDGDPSVADALIQLAGLARERGDPAAARMRAERALVLLAGSGEAESSKRISALHELGISLRRLGNEQAAWDTLAHARALATAPGHESLSSAAILSSLATLERATGDTAAAAADFRRALNVLRVVLPDGHPQYALVLRNLASLENATGRCEQAEHLYRQALDILETSLGEDHPDVAATYVGLANALEASGRPDAARMLYSKAIRIHREALGPENPALALDYHNLAALLLEIDEPDSAMQLAREAEDLSRRHFRLIAQGISEQEALHYAAGRVTGLDIALTVAARSDSTEDWERAWDLVVRSRALVIDELAQRHRFLAEAIRDPEILRLAEGLKEASNRLAFLAVRGRGLQTREEYLRRLAAARDEKEAAERELAARNREARARQDMESVGLEDVMASLPPRTAMIAWVRFNLLERAAGSAAPGLAGAEPSSYAAFVVDSASRRPRLIRLGRAADIDSLVAEWRRQAGADPLERGRETAETAYRAAGERLRRAVWDPVVEDLDEVERVFLIPDGALYVVNFETLPGENGGYLVEHAPLLHVLSTERELTRSDHLPAHGSGLLTVADPDFRLVPPVQPEAADSDRPPDSRGVSCGDFTSRLFPRLPGTAAEQREVVRLWKECGLADAEAHGDPAAGIYALSGATATEREFKRLAAGRGMIHIATHGFYLGADCAGDRVPAGRTAWDELTVSGLVAESPLLLSGFALAGATHHTRASRPDQDGIVTAEEITNLDLDGVSWVVLSACETGLGRIEAGEGVFGLRRAFQVAGSGNLVLSLWSVSDEETETWMTSMFEHRLREGQPAAEAARAASLHVLEQRRAGGETTHPYYWGAFLTTGDWR